MATILKEYEELKSINKNTVGYVLLDVGVSEVDKQYIAIDDLRIAVNDTTSKKVTSVKELRLAIEEGKLYQKQGEVDLGRPIKVTRDNIDAKVYKKSVEMPQEYITSTYQPTEGEITNISEGFKRVLEVKHYKGFTGKYVYCKLTGDDEMHFYHLSEIGYVENGKFVSLESLGKSIELEALAEKKLFNQKENKLVESIYTDATCEFGAIVKRDDQDLVESIDEDNLTKNTFQYDKNGKVKIVEQQIGSHYTEQVYRKVDDDAVIDTYNYKASQHGDYIKVTYDGYNVQTLVKIETLHYVDEFGNRGPQIKVDDLQSDRRFSLVGKSVYIVTKDEDGTETEIKTKPLTLDELACNYSRLQYMQETTEDTDILADDAYLKLADGRYIKEQAIAHPLCYDFVSNETAIDDFDAYYVEVDSAEGEKKGVVVSKNAFDKSLSFIQDGVKYEFEHAYKIKRTTKAMKDCDVIQTTKAGETIEKCVALADPRYEYKSLVIERKSVAENEEIVVQAQADFEKLYKVGKYTLENTVLDDEGNWVELDNKKRYLKTDHIVLPDYTHDSPEYKFFEDNECTFDGKTLKHGKAFSAKKANKKEFKELREISKNLIKFAFSGAGIIFFPVSIAILIGLPIVALSIPIKNAIRERRYNDNKHQFKNKIVNQRKAVTKEIIKSFELVYEETITAEKDPKKTLHEANLLSKFEEIEQMIYSLSESKLFSDFRMVEGKGTVNETNAQLYSKYRSEMKALEKEIKSLEKKAKKDKTLVAELKLKKAQQLEMVKSYVSQGVIEPEDKNMRELLERSNILKGYLIKRFFRGELSEQEKKALDSVYNIRVKHAKLYDKQDQFKQGITLIEECKELGATTHYDYSHNIIEESKYTIREKSSEEIVEDKRLEEEHKKHIEEDKTVDGDKVAKVEEPVKQTPVTTEEKKVVKNRLSKKNLEQLLKDIKELRRLDDLYYGPDEDIPADIEEQISQLEAKIKPSIHMLKSCVNKENYAQYKKAVIEAAKEMKLHISFKSKTNKINIGKIDTDLLS